MNCGDFEILLQLAADGEITDEEQSALEVHLDDCVACRRKEAWLELLDEHFALELSPSIQGSSALADAVVDAVGTPRSAEELADLEASSKRAPTVVRPRARKKGLFSRFVSSVWSRRKRRRVKSKSSKEQEGSGWIDASVSVLQLAPTSLDGFRAAKQGVSSAVSGPMRAFKWVAGAVPRTLSRKG